jgi:von Willebrand factor type A domain
VSVGRKQGANAAPRGWRALRPRASKRLLVALLLVPAWLAGLCPPTMAGSSWPAQEAADAALASQIEALREAGEFVGSTELLAVVESLSPSAWSYFKEALPKLRSTATRTRLLGALGGFSAAEAGLRAEVEAHLLATLDDKTGETGEKAAAARALAGFGGEARQHLTRMVLSRKPDALRLAALEALVEADPTLGPSLTAALLSADLLELDRQVPVEERGEDRPALRLRAMELCAEALPAEIIERALDDAQAPLRIRALREWGRRRAATAQTKAEQVFMDRGLGPEERGSAGQIWVELGDAEVLKRALEEATEWLGLEKFNAGDEMQSRQRQAALAFADRLGAWNHAPAQELAAEGLGRAASIERLFRLELLSEQAPASAEAGLRKCLDDEEMQVQERAITILARLDAGAELVGLVTRTKDPYLASIPLANVAERYRSDQKFADWLQNLPAKDRRPEVRRAALWELAGVGALPRDILTEALISADFSDQLAAVRALTRLRRPESIELLVGALPNFGARVLPEAIGSLAELTGQPFGEVPELWARWYAERGQGMQPISPSRAAEIRATREDLRADAGTQTVQFFGIPLRGERIVFVIDVSGSMQAETSPDARATGSEAGGRMRMAVAKEQLAQAIRALPEAVAFEVVTFDSSVRSFDRGPDTATKSRVEKALKFVAGLRPGSGTNLWGGLAKALEYEGVDTIVLLSDGEPSEGEIIQPAKVASTFLARNRWRGIRVHTIAFGLRLGLLEALARQSGGQYRFVP